MNVLLLILASLQTFEAVPKLFSPTERGGAVCIADTADFRTAKACHPTERARFDAEADRYFLWRSDNGTVVWIGKTSRESSVGFDPSNTATLSLRIRHADAGGSVRPETTLTLRNAAGRTWTVPFTARKIDQLRLLAVPAGTYDLTITTPRYFQSFRRGIDARNGLVTEVPPIDIARLPRITGVIRDRVTGYPIADAKIEGDNAITSSDAAGRFSLDLSTLKETYLTVHAGGYATRDVPLALRHGELPPIFLTRGAVIRLAVTRECIDDCETIARLFERRDLGAPGSRWKQLSWKTSAGRTIEYRFDGVAPGSYAVLLEGKLPLQRDAAYFAITGDESKEETLAIHDHSLKGIITFGSRPLARSTLTLSAILHCGPARFAPTITVNIRESSGNPATGV